jgi:CRISPR system Cascade subunit CasA
LSENSDAAGFVAAGKRGQQVTGRRGASGAAAALQGRGSPVATAAFDLYSQPWIPVVGRAESKPPRSAFSNSGAQEHVSLRTAIAEAHLIDGLSTTDGPRFAGLLRLLLALVMDAYGQPANDREWAARRKRGSFDADVVDEYVATVGRSRFDLFDPHHPFMQSATTPDEGKSISELLPHVASGNRTPIFTPDTDATPRMLTAAEAAQALLAAQAVAVPSLGRAAGDDPRESWAGASFAGRAAIIGFCCPLGENLFETLMLNLPNGTHQRLDATDRPVWRRDDVPHSRRIRRAEGMADLLTWTPRRVRLIPDGAAPPGPLPGGFVSRVCFRGGDALPALELAHEPHTALRLSDGKGGTAVPAGQWYPRKHLQHTIGWRGIPQLLALGERRQDSRPSIVMQSLGDRLELLGPDYRVTVLAMYVEYGQMSAVIDQIATDTFPLPVKAFGENEIDVRDMLVDLVNTADQVRYLVRGYAADVYAVTRRDLEKERTASKAFSNAVEAELVSRIDTITRRLLTDLAAKPDAMDVLRAAWTDQLRAVVDSTLAAINTDCGPGVFALIAATNASGRKTVGVLPPASRLAILRAKLAPFLGQDQEEVTT